MYPADVYLELDLSQWERKERNEFLSTFHEKNNGRKRGREEILWI